MRYAEIAVNAPVAQTFHYHIPDELDGVLEPGHLVRVAFGPAMQPGVVIAFHDESPVEKTKPVLALLDRIRAVPPAYLALAQWLREFYLAPPGPCLWLMLPPGITGRSTRQVSLLESEAMPDDPVQRRIVDLVREKGTQKQPDVLKKVGRKGAEALTELQSAGIISVDPTLSQPAVRPRTVRTIRSLVPPAAMADALRVLSRAHRQAEILRVLAERDAPFDVPDLLAATGGSSSELRRLEERGFVHLSERVIFRDSLADRDFVPVEAPVLTPDQQRIWDRIQPTLSEGGRYLLHGVTGSGKTEIYLRAIGDALERGHQALFLVPEIALTPQTIRRVAERFNDQVGIVHGSLSPGERYDTWRRARSGDIGVIVGTRSALFTPLPHLGLIVIDEEHDHSYKHAPPFNPPYYHARAAAEQLARITGSALIMGSASPDVETMYRARNGELQYLLLPQRIMGHRRRVENQARRAKVTARYEVVSHDTMTIDLPPVEVVDMREELKAGNRSIFSRLLQGSLVQVLERQEQAILFLNRRGQASYIFCRDCGHVMHCTRCDTPLTYHRANEALRCHHCGQSQPTPKVCPACRSKRIKYFGAGTQQVEEMLHAQFPGVRSLRWDADTVSSHDEHELILGRFAAHEADILIGTQMIAKGLDLPLVTLVGVVSADPGLALPDFRAEERVFQLLMQVAGRAGRGILGGQVVLQTYQPQHRSIQSAAQHDYAGFYADEIALRHKLAYPPYRRLARILVQSTHPVNVQRDAEALAERLQQHISRRDLRETQLIGPAPCFYRRIDGQYRWHILVRSPDPLAALRGLSLRPGQYLEFDPLDLL